MAKDVANHLGPYYLRINSKEQNNLLYLRSWENLKVGIDGEDAWVTNFTYAQINSVEVKKIPNAMRYRAEGGKLFPLGKLLPERNEPSLLWTYIQRASPIELTGYNHNYFGIQDKINIKIIPTEKVKNASGMLVNIGQLSEVINQLLNVRLAPLKWCFINEQLAFIVGRPILPLNATVYWCREHFFLPLGYDFELPILLPYIEEVINQEQEAAYFIWSNKGEFIRIPKSTLTPLTLSGFKRSVEYQNGVVKLKEHG